jgi:hypothetical protein
VGFTSVVYAAARHGQAACLSCAQPSHVAKGGRKAEGCLLCMLIASTSWFVSTGCVAPNSVMSEQFVAIGGWTKEFCRSRCRDACLYAWLFACPVLAHSQHFSSSCAAISIPFAAQPPTKGWELPSKFLLARPELSLFLVQY